MEVTLNERDVDQIREYIKGMYRHLGTYEGAKAHGLKDIGVSAAIDLCKYSIQFAEAILNEKHLTEPEKKRMSKEFIDELRSKLNNN